MMATFLRIAALLVTVIIPGGFLLLPVYLAFRASRSTGPALDFATEGRRVPQTRRPPPSANELRRILRRLQRVSPVGAR